MQPCKLYHGVASEREVQQKQDKITWMLGRWAGGGVGHAVTAREGGGIQLC